MKPPPENIGKPVGQKLTFLHNKTLQSTLNNSYHAISNTFIIKYTYQPCYFYLLQFSYLTFHSSSCIIIVHSSANINLYFSLIQFILLIKIIKNFILFKDLSEIFALLILTSKVHVMHIHVHMFIFILYA
jgi:hypothetical protein